AWSRCSASFTGTEAKCGRRRSRTKALRSISPSVPEGKWNRKVMKLRREANHELREARHTVGGRQSGRCGSRSALAAAGEAGKQHLRRPRWRGSSGLSLLSRGVHAPIIRSSPQAGVVGFETSQGGWNGSAQTGQERPSDQDYPSRYYDLLQRRAGFGGQLQPGG